MLCRAHRSVAKEPIFATDQKGRTFWAAVSAKFRWWMSQAGPPRGRGCGIRQSPARRGGAALVARWQCRSTIAITKGIRDHIAKNTQLLASSFTVVDQANLTGTRRRPTARSLPLPTLTEGTCTTPCAETRRISAMRRPCRWVSGRPRRWAAGGCSRSWTSPVVPPGWPVAIPSAAAPPKGVLADAGAVTMEQAVRQGECGALASAAEAGGRLQAPWMASSATARKRTAACAHFKRAHPRRRGRRRGGNPNSLWRASLMPREEPSTAWLA